jgi:hypothetical protein
MRHIPITAILLATSLVAACGFQSKTSLLAPTAPSSNSPSNNTSNNTPTDNRTSSSSSNSPFAGTWASPTINGLPNIGSCSDLQWQISNLSATEVAGTVTAVCAGSVTVTANLTGKLNGNDVVDLTANGQAVAFGITCGFGLTGVGTRQTADSVKLDYQGTTCLGPVSGSEILRRKSPEPPSPVDPPQPPDPPAPPDPPDDDVFGCTSMLPDKMFYVGCIHSHIHPTNEYGAFEVTKRVAWGLREEGAGLLLKPTGENIVTWRGYTFAAGRIIYADGHLFKVIADVGPGGSNAPSWQDEGFLDVSRRLPALDPKLP